MKTITVLVGLVGMTVLIGLSQARSAQRPPGAVLPIVFQAATAAGDHFKAVRAEYVVEQPTSGSIETELVITNTSATKWVKLKDLVVLGRNGLRTVLAVHRGHRGTLVPPLGQVMILVDRKLGVAPRGKSVPRSARDVASTVLAWEGPADAVKLSAIIRERAGSAFFGSSVEDGYDLTF